MLYGPTTAQQKPNGVTGVQGQWVPDQGRLHPHQHLRGGGLHEDGRIQVGSEDLFITNMSVKKG